jgi:hypothetical protein
MMATVTKKQCDVTGKIHDDVRTVRILVDKVTVDSADAITASVSVLERQPDLSPRALERLTKAIAKALEPYPSKKSE